MCAIEFLKRRKPDAMLFNYMEMKIIIWAVVCISEFFTKVMQSILETCMVQICLSAFAVLRFFRCL
jgi:hypothetical protein